MKDEQCFTFGWNITLLFWLGGSDRIKETRPYKSEQCLSLDGSSNLQSIAQQILPISHQWLGRFHLFVWKSATAPRKHKLIASVNTIPNVSFLNMDTITKTNDNEKTQKYSIAETLTQNTKNTDTENKHANGRPMTKFSLTGFVIEQDLDTCPSPQANKNAHN